MGFPIGCCLQTLATVHSSFLLWLCDAAIGHRTHSFSFSCSFEPNCFSLSLFYSDEQFFFLITLYIHISVYLIFSLLAYCGECRIFSSNSYSGREGNQQEIEASMCIEILCARRFWFLYHVCSQWSTNLLFNESFLSSVPSAQIRMCRSDLLDRVVYLFVIGLFCT